MKFFIKNKANILFTSLSLICVANLLPAQVRQQVGQAISGRTNDMIACGPNHSLVVKKGKVYASGLNAFGQLGDGTYEDSSIPVEVKGLDHVISVTTGGDSSLALKSDGTVWAWGDNLYGQLGDGTNDDTNVPVQVKGISNIISISASLVAAYALRADGTVWAWGLNGEPGSLGQNSAIYASNIPLQVKGPEGIGYLTNVIAISASSYLQHVMALKSDGTVWSWGINEYGQLGNNSVEAEPAPIKVHNLKNIIAVAAGSRHSLALGTNGTVWAWGHNVAGQLGNGSIGGYKKIPLQVKGPAGVGILSNIISVAVGDGSGTSWALAADGVVWAWGGNDKGQIGDGTVGSDKSFPSAVKDLDNVTALFGRGFQYCFALRANGTIWAWGQNTHGAFGNGQINSQSTPLPLHVDSLPEGTLCVASGANHCLDLDTSGQVFSWGSNESGQLGNAASGANTDENSPVNVVTSHFLLGGKKLLLHVKAVAGGRAHSLALKSDGRVYAWGNNNSGQLGNGTYIQKSFASSVVGSDGQTALSHIVAIAASTSGDHNLALSSNGSVWSWGSNTNGQLGNGNKINQNIPIEITGLSPQDISIKQSHVIAVAAGRWHSLALKADGTVWAWGSNYFGQLGIGANGAGNDVNIPILVTGLNNVIAIAAGAQHSLALTSDGTIWAWGNNAEGQLSTGTTVDSNVPVQVLKKILPGLGKIRLTNVKAIAGGASPLVGFGNLLGTQPIDANSIALTANGNVFTWGNNGKGQLGIAMTGGYKNLATPAQDIEGNNLTAIKSISNLGYHSIICRDDWKTLTVGDNDYGQLGNGTFDGNTSLYYTWD